MATDADENDMLTYTLWWGDSSDNLSKTDITATGRSGQSVILEKSGLSNDTRYWFKVVVSDGIDEVTSGEGNENTYCKGEYCNGVSYSYETCTASGCDNGKINCTTCRRHRRNKCKNYMEGMFSMLGQRIFSLCWWKLD